MSHKEEATGEASGIARPYAAPKQQMPLSVILTSSYTRSKLQGLYHIPRRAIARPRRSAVVLDMNRWLLNCSFRAPGI
jgi:hypothetical protein